MYRVIRDEPPELGNNHTVVSGGDSNEGEYQKAGALVVIMVREVHSIFCSVAPHVREPIYMYTCIGIEAFLL